MQTVYPPQIKFAGGIKKYINFIAKEVRRPSVGVCMRMYIRADEQHANSIPTTNKVCGGYKKVY